jgi:hypothetical protein
MIEMLVVVIASIASLTAGVLAVDARGSRGRARWCAGVIAAVAWLTFAFLLASSG